MEKKLLVAHGKLTENKKLQRALRGIGESTVQQVVAKLGEELPMFEVKADLDERGITVRLLADTASWFVDEARDYLLVSAADFLEALIIEIGFVV